MQPTLHDSDRYLLTPIPLVIARWRDAVSFGAEGLSLYWHHDNLRIGGGVTIELFRTERADESWKLSAGWRTKFGNS